MAIAPSAASFIGKPIKFGTDGWRGMIAADFTFERVAQVAAVAARVLEACYGQETGSKTVIVGFDRRFLSPEFARLAADSVAAAGYDVMLSDQFAPTPAFSWAAKDQTALGAIVITASHNPAAYSGLKVKSAHGGSVPPEVTQKIEAKLSEPVPPANRPGTVTVFDPWPSYCSVLRSRVDIDQIRTAVERGALTVFADVMHGAAAGGLEKLLGVPINEINGAADPLFEGAAPEPLPQYIPKLYRAMKAHHQTGGGLSVGVIFDGDSDRIAGMDTQGNFLSSQVLIPVLIDHLKAQRGFTGEVVKTISGSELMRRVAQLHGLPVYETAIGYKYIADRMLETQVMLGGEESGGIGYGHHIPERDALLSALYVLEAVVQSGRDLGALNQSLREQTGFSGAYDRIDLPLASMEARAKLLDHLQNQTPKEVASKPVASVLDIDGYKFTFADGSWLLIRFSGTEPILRLYSEAATLEEVHEYLGWAKDWATAIA